MRLFSPESTHWYTREGKPMHTVKDAKGNDRATTLRDARKLRLLPSVTNVTGIIAKDGLMEWKMENCVQAALTLPRQPGEELGAFAERVAEDAKSSMSAAAEFGTKFHAAAQRVAENPLGLSETEELYPWLLEYRNWMEANVERVLWTEKVLVNPVWGYAGTADLLCIHRKRGLCLVDLKTQKIAHKRLPRIYPSWQYQLAAYQRVAGREVTCLNLVVDSTRPRIEGEHVWSANDIEYGWRVFEAALFIWGHEKGYGPGVAMNAGTFHEASDLAHNERILPNTTEACR